MPRKIRWGKGLILRLQRKHLPVLLIPITRGPLGNFYHFLIGYFLPVYHQRMVHPDKSLAVASCPPYDQWWELVPGKKLKVIQASSAMQQSYLAGSKRFTNKYEVVGLIGWDKWERFPSRPIRAISEHLRNHLSHRNPTGSHSQAAVVLGRNYVPSDVPENLKERYGARKRNIPNLDELTEALNSLLPTQLVEPGTWSPRDLAKQCQETSVLIAQHGAALANAILLPSGSTVMEITWRGFQESPYARIYELLCKELGIDYVSVVAQDDCLSPADASITLEAVKGIVEQSGGSRVPTRAR